MGIAIEDNAHITLECVGYYDQETLNALGASSDYVMQRDLYRLHLQLNDGISSTRFLTGTIFQRSSTLLCSFFSAASPGNPFPSASSFRRPCPRSPALISAHHDHPRAFLRHPRVGCHEAYAMNTHGRRIFYSFSHPRQLRQRVFSVTPQRVRI